MCVLPLDRRKADAVEHRVRGSLGVRDRSSSVSDGFHQDGPLVEWTMGVIRQGNPDVWSCCRPNSPGFAFCPSWIGAGRAVAYTDSSLRSSRGAEQFRAAVAGIRQGRSFTQLPRPPRGPVDKAQSRRPGNRCHPAKACRIRGSPIGGMENPSGDRPRKNVDRLLARRLQILLCEGPDLYTPEPPVFWWGDGQRGGE